MADSILKKPDDVPVSGAVLLWFLPQSQGKVEGMSYHASHAEAVAAMGQNRSGNSSYSYVIVPAWGVDLAK